MTLAMLTYEFKQRLREFLQSHFKEMGDARLETVFRFLLLPRVGPDDPIGPGTVALLQSGPARFVAFLVPQGGGLVTAFESQPVQVLTMDSPLGQAIAGHRMGDSVSVEMPGRPSRTYQVLETA